MPITIRELVIRTTIVDPDEESMPSRESMGGEDQDLFEDLVEECVAQVLERMSENNER